MTDPVVTIVILNHNGRQHLPDCLGSLAHLDYPADRLEILIVDNGSTDDSAAWVREHFPRASVLELGQNLGFAEGNNRGAAAAKGEIVAFLNTDTRVDPRWLSELIAPLAAGDQDNVVATASKMLDWEGKGLDFPVYATLLGMPYASREARPYRRPADYDTPHYLLFASGGAMAVRRDAFLTVGGFDADYFMYHEDVDLGWRLWLQGHRVLYVPAAIVYHRLGGSSADDASWLYFLNERNALFTVIKNVGDAWLVRLLPLLLLWLIERLGLYLGVDPAAYGPGREPSRPGFSKTVPRGVLAAVAAVMDLIRHFPRLLEKRAAVQARRIRSDEEIATLLELPRDVFVQMLLGADADFTRAVRLLDDVGLGAGDASVFGRVLRRLDRAAGPAEPVGRYLIDCLLYLADHTPVEAEAQFGPDIVTRLAASVGVAITDLHLLARTLTLAGSKLLAGMVAVESAAKGMPAEQAPKPQAPGKSIASNGLLALMRETVWRDAVFYREELTRRTDQLLRMLRDHRVRLEAIIGEHQQRLSQLLAREAAWRAERDRMQSALATARRAWEHMQAEPAEAWRARDQVQAELAAAQQSQEYLDVAVRDLEKRLEQARVFEAASAAERATLEAGLVASRLSREELERRLAQGRAHEDAWAIERAAMRADQDTARRARDQAVASLRQVLQSRRYRFGHFLAVSWWLAIHPRYSVARVREESWQWLRAVLPDAAKRWMKRVVLRKPHDTWGVPEQSKRPNGIVIRPAAISPVVHTTRRSTCDVIIFSVIDWQFRFQRPQQLACQFAEGGHRVFYVSISFDDTAWGAQTAAAPTITSLRPHVYELRLAGPSSLKVYRDRMDGEVLDRCVAAFEILQVGQGIVDAIGFVQLPFWRPLAARLRERFGWKVVYDCLDRHSGFSTNDPAMLAEETALARESDLVVATSQLLFDEHRALNPRTIRVPNATDFAHFSAFVGEAPIWLQQVGRPLIGYYGAIADWFDTSLMGELARARPHWTFVLVGSTYTADLRPLEGLPNVHLPGEQPYGTLPAYLHSFDVCLIPFQRVPLTEATNPVKFYEYLSAGKPVVAVRLPELQPHEAEDLVYLADDASSFASQIERAIVEDSPVRIINRMRFAGQQTWEARYRQLDGAIRQLYRRVSIIIPTHNNLHLTRLCIDGIMRNTTWPNYEIIVVDNASTDGTPVYLRELAARHESVRCIFNERNEGFARANNQGIAAASGDYVVLLNNDTIVTRGWLTAMVRYLEAHPEVGMIGPATNLAGNEAKIDVAYTNVEELEAFAETYTREHADRTLELAMLGFFCVVIPRRILDEVGLLDERFGIGTFEDDDLSLRVRRAGYRLICTDSAFVHHFHMATFRRFSEQEYQRMFEANREKYEQKWNTRWTPHRYRWQR